MNAFAARLSLETLSKLFWNKSYEFEEVQAIQAEMFFLNVQNLFACFHVSLQPSVVWRYLKAPEP